MSRTTQIIWTVFVRFLGKSANVAVLVILARELSVADLGIYGFLFVACIISSVALDVGVRNSAAFYIGKSPERGGDIAVQTLLLYCAFAAAAFLAAPLLLTFSDAHDAMPTLLLPTALNILSLLYIRMEQGILLGTGQIARFNRTELVPRVVLLTATVGALLADAITLSSALVILAISNLFGAVAVAAAVLPMYRRGSWRSWRDSKQLVRRGFVFMLGVVAMLAAQKIAFFVVARIGSENEGGLFYGLLRLTEFMTEIGLAVSVVVFSTSVRAVSKKDAVRDAAESTRVCAALFLVLTVIAYLTAPVLVSLLLGSEFSGYESLFRILLIGTFFGTVWTMVFPTLTAVDHPVVALLIMVPNLIFGTILAWLLYKSYGLTGAAWAMVLSQAVLTLSMLFMFKFRHQARIRDFLFLSRQDMRKIASRGRGKKTVDTPSSGGVAT